MPVRCTISSLTTSPSTRAVEQRGTHFHNRLEFVKKYKIATRFTVMQVCGEFVIAAKHTFTATTPISIFRIRNGVGIFFGTLGTVLGFCCWKTGGKLKK